MGMKTPFNKALALVCLFMVLGIIHDWLYPPIFPTEGRYDTVILFWVLWIHFKGDTYGS
jgi:hypothetical protein